MSPLERLWWLLGIIWSFFAGVWWFVVPVILFGVLSNLWILYLKTRKLHAINWSLLEIHVPREILRTPKAMEQIFAALNAIDSDISFTDKWWKGKTIEWLSFEMVGVAHGVHFFIRVPANYRNLLEAAIYAQYPGAEIRELADDYTELVPAHLPNETYDLFGASLKLKKDEVYPIRTYPYFEDIDEDKRLDPLAAITEVMSGLKEGEIIWFQLLVRPTDRNPKDMVKKAIEEIVGKKKIMETGEEVSAGLMSVTPLQRDVIKAIEEKTAKLLFETCIRYLYIDHRASFTRSNAAAVYGAIQQFNTKNMNSLGANSKALTIGKWPFWKQRRLHMRKRKLFNAYKKRWFADGSKVSPWAQGFLMNTEELATIYHFPISVVAAPHLGRLETKKGSPPANLPIG